MSDSDAHAGKLAAICVSPAMLSWAAPLALATSVECRRRLGRRSWLVSRSGSRSIEARSMQKGRGILSKKRRHNKLGIARVFSSRQKIVPALPFGPILFTFRLFPVSTQGPMCWQPFLGVDMPQLYTEARTFTEFPPTPHHTHRHT